MLQARQLAVGADDDELGASQRRLGSQSADNLAGSGGILSVDEKVASVLTDVVHRIVVAVGTDRGDAVDPGLEPSGRAIGGVLQPVCRFDGVVDDADGHGLRDPPWPFAGGVVEP